MQKSTKTILFLSLIAFCLAACKDDKAESPRTSTPQVRIEYIHVGPNWEAVHTLKPPENSFEIGVTTAKESYRKGEKISFRVSSPKAGRLWVVQVDPDDELTVLFPNDRAPDNSIAANAPVTLPGEDANWAIEAGDPVGKSVVAFIVTTGDADLSNVLGAGRKELTKALQIVEAEPSWGISKVVIDVQE